MAVLTEPGGKIQLLRQAHPTVRGLRFTRNFGHQSAILAGLLAARGDAVIVMDADGQHPPELIPVFLERWREGYQVVQAIRTTGTDAPIKSLFSRLFYRILHSLSGVDVPAGSADFRLLGRPVVDAVLQSAGHLLFLRGLVSVPRDTKRHTCRFRRRPALPDARATRGGRWCSFQSTA